MAIRTELSLRLPNSPGALTRVCDALSEARVNILALHLESSGRLRLVVDNPLQARGILGERRHQLEEREILYTLLPNTPGALAAATRLLAEGDVNLEYAYVAAVEGAAMAAAVFGVANAARASAAAGL
jgi:hypothetical protein